MHPRRVIRADSPLRAGLEAEGWIVVARSWGAGLVVEAETGDHLARLVERAASVVSLRELDPGDADAVLALDHETLGDYPGDIATAHAPLTADQATPTDDHRGWGAFTPAGLLVAMTFSHVGGELTETDFTVVRRGWRGRGIGTAVKAASVLALAADGHRSFRTGGSADNPASIAANRAVGYELDEEWITLVDGTGGRSGGMGA